MTSSQHRRVFVGNIPYDATEEQLIEICREVGPVVSFRLVTDRETGKPKGFGFCEYKDEETALSACRNIQGYEINGRQLRVDFAENDKNTDKNQERGRGGPGLAANVGVPVNQRDLIHNLPTGVHLAGTASMVMSAALGRPQAGIQSNQSGLQSQAALGYDPLTSHLAKMSQSQLTEIMSELKMMATKDKDLARQLLLSRPQLSKAVFQAQIMLNMVTSQVLQMPNLQQPPSQLSPGQFSQEPEVQTTVGLPPSALNKLPAGVVSKSQEVVASNLDQKVVPNQFISSIQRPVPLTQTPGNHAVPQNSVLGQSSSMLSSINLQSLISIPSMLPNHPGQGGAPSLHSIRANNIKHSPLLTHPSLSDVSNKEQDGPPKVVEDANWIHRSNKSKMLFGSTNKLNNLLSESPVPNNRASNLILSDGRRASYSGGPPGISNTNDLSEVFGLGTLAANAAPNLDLQNLQQQYFQTLLPPEVQFSLLQQVLSLTPEQLSSLPVEQQQLVSQLQEVIHRDQIWPSQPYYK